MLLEFAEHQVAAMITPFPPIRVWYKHYIWPSARIPHVRSVLPPFDSTLEKQWLADTIYKPEMFHGLSLLVPHRSPIFDSTNRGVGLDVIA